MCQALLLLTTVLGLAGCLGEHADRAEADSGVLPAPPPTSLPDDPGAPPAPPGDEGWGMPLPQLPAPVTRDRPDAGVPSSSAEAACQPGATTALVDGLAAAHGTTAPIAAVVRTSTRDALELEDDHGHRLTLGGWAAGDLASTFPAGTTVTWDGATSRLGGPGGALVLLTFSLEGQTGPEPDELRVEAWDVVCSSWRACDLGNSEVVSLNVMLESNGDRLLLQPGTTARLGGWTVAYGEVIAEYCPVGRRPPFDNRLQALRPLGE